MALKIGVIVCAHHEAEKSWPAIKSALRSNVDIALTLFTKRQLGGLG